MSSGSLPTGFFLLSLRGLKMPSRCLSPLRSQLPLSAHSPPQKRRAGLRSPNPHHSRGSDAKSWFFMDFVSFWFLDLTVNSYGRKCLALKLSCIVRASARLPFLQADSGVRGEPRVLKSCPRLLPTPQSCYGSLIRKVLVTWLFGPLSVRMARPLRGHAWPGRVCQHLQVHNHSHSELPHW